MQQNNSINLLNFNEHPIRNHVEDYYTKYDVTALGMDIPQDFKVNGAFSQEHYCDALLKMIAQLQLNQLKDFLHYQLDLMSYPEKWSETLRKLLIINKVYYQSLGPVLTFDSALAMIGMASFSYFNVKMTQYKDQLQQLIFKGFSVSNFRSNLESIESLEERHTYLLNLKSTFLEKRPLLKIYGKSNFGKVLNLEIKKVNRAIRLKQEQKVGEPKYKIPTELSVPELTYLFRALQQIGKFKPKTNMDLFQLIANHHESKKSEQISWQSVKNHFNNPPERARKFWEDTFIDLFNFTKGDKEK